MVRVGEGAGSHFIMVKGDLLWHTGNCPQVVPRRGLEFWLLETSLLFSHFNYDFEGMLVIYNLVSQEVLKNVSYIA